MAIHCKSHDGPLRIILKCSDVIWDLIMTDWSVTVINTVSYISCKQYNRISRIYRIRSQFWGGNNPKWVNAAADGAVCGDHVVCDEHRIDFNWSSWRVRSKLISSRRLPGRVSANIPPLASRVVAKKPRFIWAEWLYLTLAQGASPKHRPVKMGD